MAEVTDEFLQCWQAAGTQLQDHAGDQINSWIRAHLIPTFLEHLSFRLGNQLFFIRIEDVDDQLKTPGNPDGLFTVADVCNGHTCAMPMQLVSGDHGERQSGQLQPTEPGWGLLDARTRQPINPVALISDELIEITDWELQDFAVEVVRHYLTQVGREIISFNS